MTDWEERKEKKKTKGRLRPPYKAIKERYTALEEVCEKIHKVKTVDELKEFSEKSPLTSILLIETFRSLAPRKPRHRVIKTDQGAGNILLLETHFLDAAKRKDRKPNSVILATANKGLYTLAEDTLDFLFSNPEKSLKIINEKRELNWSTEGIQKFLEVKIFINE